MRICSPVIKHPCHLGIDMQSYSQLIGANKTEKEICEYLGADSLKYLTVEQLVESCKDAKIGFCLGCFNGIIPTAWRAINPANSNLNKIKTTEKRRKRHGNFL